MTPPEDILSSLGLDQLITEQHFTSNLAAGTLANSAGARVVCAGPEMMRSLHLVLEQEHAGAWAAAMTASGHAVGKNVATNLETELAALGKPALAALPLEACLVLVERHFAVQGWGRLKLDLADAAEHGVVVAHVEHSYFAGVLPAARIFVDPFLAGILLGFFEHISGQSLGCEEIACARRGASHCTFVITAPERLATVLPFVGRESADAIIARLRV